MSRQAYAWIGSDGGWRVGRTADVDGMGVLHAPIGSGSGEVLMRDHHRGDLSLVPAEQLVAYPNSPIPEPEPRGYDR